MGIILWLIGIGVYVVGYYIGVDHEKKIHKYWEKKEKEKSYQQMYN